MKHSAGLVASEVAPGLVLGEGVELGADVELGANVVIHAGTRLGAGAVIGDGAVIGKTPHLARHSVAPRENTSPAVIGEGAAVLTGAVVFAGAKLGSGAIAGDQSQVRERAVIGEGSVIGRGTSVDNDVSIAKRVRVQANCYLTAFSHIDDDVFIGPGATMTNDNTMARCEPGALEAPRLHRACRIGAGAVLCPGVEIGEEAFVAAGAVVIANVPPRAVVMGVPARQRGEVPDADLLDRWR